MHLISSHFLILIQIFIGCLFFSISGFLLKYLIFKEKDLSNFYENGLFGFFLIGFISLGLNFFLPLNLIINNIIFITIFIVGYKLNFFNQNTFNLIKKYFVTFIAYLFLIYSSNRPDGHIYHLHILKLLMNIK